MCIFFNACNTILCLKYDYFGESNIGYLRIEIKKIDYLKIIQNWLFEKKSFLLYIDD